MTLKTILEDRKSYLNPMAVQDHMITPTNLVMTLRLKSLVSDPR